MTAKGSQPETIAIQMPLRPKTLGWYGVFRRITIFVIILLSCLDFANYFSITRGVAPKYTYIVLFSFSLPIIALEVTMLPRVLLSSFSIWYASFLTIVFVHLIFILLISSDIHADIVLTAFLVFLITSLLAMLTLYASINDLSFPIISASLIIPVFIVLDFVSPGTFYPIATIGSVLARGAGTFINPNRAGEAALLTLLLALPYLSYRSRVLFFIITGFGVLATFSRAAILGWFLLSTLCLYSRTLPRYFLALPVIAILGMLSVSTLLEYFLRSYLGIDGGITDILDRLTFIQSANTSDYSSNERLSLFLAGVNLFADYPFLGAGSGATNVWSYSSGPHNQLVLLASEYGLFGIILWLSMLLIAIRGDYFQNKSLQYAAAVMIGFFSMFSHNLIDSIYWLFTLAIVSRPAEVRKQL
jgi:hypothetical protein